jgi:hypothetical protein
MGFLGRRAERNGQSSQDLLRQAESRYGSKPSRPNADPVELPIPSQREPQSEEPLGRSDPQPARSAAKAGRTDPEPGRSDLAQLLGRTVLEARVQRICREYGLLPPDGNPDGFGLSRVYLARGSGVELAANTHGIVTKVFLHFHGDDGFESYAGEIPGCGGAVPSRASLWAELGHPAESGDPYRERFLGDFGPWDRWVLPGLQLRAQYALDGDSVQRITLTLPD